MVRRPAEVSQPRTSGVSPVDDEIELATLLLGLSRQVSDTFNDVWLPRTSFARPHINALVELDEPHAIRDLAAALKVEASNITSIVDLLGSSTGWSPAP